MTEKQIEECLTDESREVVTTAGTRRVVRMSRLHWDNYDFLRVMDDATPDQLVAYAEEEVVLQKIDFDRAFKNVVAYLASRWKP